MFIRMCYNELSTDLKSAWTTTKTPNFPNLKEFLLNP